MQVAAIEGLRGLMESHPSVSFVFASDGSGILSSSEGTPPSDTFTRELDVVLLALETFSARNIAPLEALVIEVHGSVIVVGSRGAGRGAVGAVATERGALGLLVNRVHNLCKDLRAAGDDTDV